MNKKLLVKNVAEKTSYSQKDITEVVDATLEAITDALKSGEEVSISGFGKFSVAERGERVGRNPKTGEAMTIAPSKAPKFKASSALKNKVNE